MIRLKDQAKEYCKENGVYEGVFSTKHGTQYTSDILVDFAKKVLLDKNVNPWRDMETAPRTGEHILVKDKDGDVYMVAWLNSSEGDGSRTKYMDWCEPFSFQDEQGGYMEISNPIGWLPCPK